MTLEKELINMLSKIELKTLSDYKELGGRYTGIIKNEEFEKLNLFSEFDRCFFSDENCDRLTFSGKHFNKCVLSIPFSDKVLFKLLKNNAFSKCVIFVSKDPLNSFLSTNDEEAISKFKTNNKLITHTYVKELCLQFNNDLSKVPFHLIKGLRFVNENLDGVKLPIDKNFFNSLLSPYIFKCRLPEIDFSIYDLSNITFDKVMFNNKSKFSDNFFYSSFVECKLPPVDFNKLDYSNNKYNYNFCEFSKGSIFPNDKYFFENNRIYNAILPPYDYSYYKMTHSTLVSFYFPDESILPNEYTCSLKLRCLLDMKNIPTKYLTDCISLTQIRAPHDFLLKYSKLLSKKDIFLLYNKYSTQLLASKIQSSC